MRYPRASANCPVATASHGAWCQSDAGVSCTPSSSARISTAMRRRSGWKMASLTRNATSLGCATRTLASPVISSENVTTALMASIKEASLGPPWLCSSFEELTFCLLLGLGALFSGSSAATALFCTFCPVSTFMGAGSSAVEAGAAAGAAAAAAAPASAGAGAGVADAAAGAGAAEAAAAVDPADSVALVSAAAADRRAKKPPPPGV
mmetsp:Transcript_70256/g.168336  ORF Transcript_70256/g.168336 Transcript_70256/m.168336 type:complete len:207 (+) Transcript_70256:1441-2061(+)